MTQEKILSKTEIDHWLDSIAKILVYVKICGLNASKMLTPKNDIQASILRRGFFQIHFIQLRQILVIELVKLFKKSERYSFVNLCSQIAESTDCDDQLLKHFDSVSRSDIEGFRSKGVCRSFGDLKTLASSLNGEIESQKEVIKKLTVQRDKIYAHSDDIRHIEIDKIEWQKVFDAVDFTVKIFDSLYIGINRTTVMFPVTMSGIESILEDLEAAQRSSENPEPA